MNNICPYCGCSMDFLNNIVREEITWDGEAWHHDPTAISAIQCPECENELDASDLGPLGLGCQKALEQAKLARRI